MIADSCRLNCGIPMGCRVGPERSLASVFHSIEMVESGLLRLLRRRRRLISPMLASRLAACSSLIANAEGLVF
jgi:hypothetical protein